MVAEPQIMLSYSQLVDDSVQTARGTYEKQHTLRVHHGYPSGEKKNGRTLDLQQTSVSRDYITTSDFKTNLVIEPDIAGIKYGAFEGTSTQRITMVC